MAEVTFSKPATYDGRKRVSARYDGLQLHLNETGRHTNQYAIERTYHRCDDGDKWSVRVTDTLVGGKPLREAKKIVAIILENADPKDEDTFVNDRVRAALSEAGYLPKAKGEATK